MRRIQQGIIAFLFVSAIGMAATAGRYKVQSAQAAPKPPQSEAAAKNAPTDDLQRSIKINSYRVVADSGVARGENIYYYKCWVCHNKYTIAANPGVSAPYLQDLFKHANLRSGDPVDDDSVIKQIKDGSSGMPSFRTSMTDADVADLLAYLKSGKCCLEGENPPLNPWYKAATNKWSVPTSVSGGPRGVVRSDWGPTDSTEGVKVQLIAPNSVRTTVYANEQGNFEFPKMQTGEYTLRIATPLEFKPYRRDGVHIEGANKIDDIVAERVTLEPKGSTTSDAEALPSTPEIEAQLSGAEILWNLTGTGQEKDTFRRGCGSGCHSYPQILRNHYDERSWALIVDRMFNYGGATLVSRSGGNAPADPESARVVTSGRGAQQDQERLVKWLAKVRGPGAVDAPMHIFPRAHGVSTRVVVTEYELPRQLLSPHDVSGDSQGNIWYTSHKSRYFGKVDPRTGIVTEYAVPLTPGHVPGTHRVIVDQKHGDTVWLSEPWGRHVTKFDPHTGQFTQVPLNSDYNIALAPDGFIWGNQDHAAVKLDPETGKIVQSYPMEKRTSYDNMVSNDGKYWAGGGPSTGGDYSELLDIATGKMNLLDMGYRLAGPSRGGFDPYDNAWFGGKNGSLVELDVKSMKMREYFPPSGYTPYTDFYEAMPDKNGEVWGGLLHGRGMVRYNPHTDRWVVYDLPEPFGHDRRTWIDNSTNPVTVWYVDYQGYLVRIQPMD